MILATEKGSTASVVKSIKAAGGWISLTSDRLGYVSASVPTGKVDSLAKSAAILAVDLNESIPLPKPEADNAGTASTAAVAAPGADTADDNPYMPTNETGAVAFKAAHGAGTAAASPSASWTPVSTWTTRRCRRPPPASARSSTGSPRTDPLLEGDGTWRAMITAVTGPTFTVRAARPGPPRPAPTSSTALSESIPPTSDAGGDVNRDGDTTDAWGVLYDATTHDIWVDVNQNRDFTDDELMRPYKEKFDVGHFGTDNPATAVAEPMPFVVEYREDVDTTPGRHPGTVDYVNIGIVEAAHGTHVAGITAANSLFGGEMDGAAPGAKIVSARACSWGGGCTAVALTDGMVDLVVNRGVDVVNMSIGGLPALNDGNNARARLYDALINDDGVQLVISAGNSGPGINTIGDPSVATDVVSVAASRHARRPGWPTTAPWSRPR